MSVSVCVLVCVRAFCVLGEGWEENLCGKETDNACCGGSPKTA